MVVGSGLMMQNTTLNSKNSNSFEVQVVITISKKPLCQVSRLFEFGASADRIAAFPRVPIVEKASRVSYWEEGLIRKNIRCVFIVAYLYIIIVLVERKKIFVFFCYFSFFLFTVVHQKATPLTWLGIIPVRMGVCPPSNLTNHKNML